MDSVIKTKNLTKTYHDFYANKDINIDIKKGCIYGLIGRNGAGKTTLMRMLCGLTLPTSGTMELLGKSGKNITEARKRIGCIIETPSFYGSMSAFDNLVVRGKMIGLKDPASSAIDALEKVGLASKSKVKADKLSLGMKQKLGLAMAILGNPELLILDEPINGLDPIAIKEIRDILIDMNKNGATILISSHILGELSKIATDYGFIINGRLVKEITAKEVKDKKVDLEQLFMEMAGAEEHD